MLSVIQTFMALLVTLIIMIIGHEIDAMISDKFEQTTGTKMRVAAIAKDMQDQRAEYAYEVTVMPIYTRQAKTARSRIRFSNFFRSISNFSKNSTSTRRNYPVNIRPVQL